MPVETSKCDEEKGNSDTHTYHQHNLDNNSVDLLKKVEMMKRKAMRAEA